MLINNTPIGAELLDLLTELSTQLAINNIPLLQQMKDTPDNIMVQCPYHKNGQERKPSAGIKKSDGTFHCFTCGETHSLQEVISFCFGHTDDIVGAFGWNWILKNFLTINVEERKDLELDCSRTNNSIYGVGCKNYVTEEELDSYRVYHNYMWKRKMTPEVVDIFDIGYDSQTQTITFPVRDRNGNCLFIARRSVNTKFFNYPSGVEKPVYGIYELYQLKEFPKEVIICESMIDCIYFWTINKYAVALNGLGNELQFKQLNQMPCRKFILCTDSDEAGMKARKRLRYNIKHKLITEYILPKGRKDANDCTLEELQNLTEVM
jgi:DNA primase